jgi:hypothetical protein
VITIEKTLKIRVIIIKGLLRLWNRNRRKEEMQITSIAIIAALNAQLTSRALSAALFLPEIKL